MSCYDRISHAALAMGLRRQNIPETAIESLITTIQGMVHKVRTTFGESAHTHGGQQSTRPNQGIPQGNGMGPPGWSIISSPCLELLRERDFGAKFTTPMSKKSVVFVGCACVDDTDQVEMEQYEGEDISSVVGRMQEAVDLWENSIRLTGGAIRPEKCHWYTLDFKWEGSNYSLSNINDVSAELSVKDSDGIRRNIERKEYDQAQKTLGVYCAPNGEMTQQCEDMKAKSRDWADKISSGHMDRVNVSIALRTTIWRTLGYPLATTLLTLEQCDEIMKPALNAALPKMGLNRHFPRAVLHGPKSLQGLEIPHLFTLQSIEHLKQLINHQLHPDITTQLLEGTIESLYLQVGLGKPFLHARLPGVDESLPNTIATCIRQL